MAARGVASLAALAAACGPARERPRERRADAASDVAPDVAPPDAAVVPPTPARWDDAAFRALADAVARRTARVVVGWGTSALAEPGAPPVRFATLLPEDGWGRGAYLLEAGPATVWLVGFYADGRTMPWGQAAVEDTPAWIEAGGGAIEHGQGHPRGDELVSLGLRGGAVVVLAHERTGDPALDEPAFAARYAVDGACVTPCPPAAGFSTEDLALEVVGPGATAAALAERAR